MAGLSNIKTHGQASSFYSDGVVIQPNFALTEKNDGTIEGTVTFITELSNANKLPQMGSVHPKDARCQIYNREVTFLKLKKVQLVASYFGLIARRTPSILSYTPNTDKEPIDTHPQFTDFAGTRSNPKNGAVFDVSDGEFIGFNDPEIKDLFGSLHYLVPSTIISLSYWSSSAPSIRRRMTVQSNIAGFRKPSDVKEFLFMDAAYRQVGSFYQVTEQYIGSGPNGFSRKVYNG